MNSKDDIERLWEAYPILQKIDAQHQDLLKSTLQFKTLYEGEYLSSAKGMCEGGILLLEGCIKIQRLNASGEETNLYNLNPGELCHEAFRCIMQFKSLDIVGRALQDSKVAFLPISFVEDYLLKESIFLAYMYEDLYCKLNQVIETKQNKLHESLESRILNYLKNQNSKKVYMTHEQLAVEIDSSRVAVSRKLKELEHKGSVQLERGRIILLEG